MSTSTYVYDGDHKIVEWLGSTICAICSIHCFHIVYVSSGAPICGYCAEKMETRYGVRRSSMDLYKRGTVGNKYFKVVQSPEITRIKDAHLSP